jgi:hypothetical protein
MLVGGGEPAEIRSTATTMRTMSSATSAATKADRAECCFQRTTLEKHENRFNA